MDKIIIQDNFLNKEQLENCINIIYDGKWNYKLNDLNSDKNIFWTMDLLNNQYLNNITKLIGKNFQKTLRLINYMLLHIRMDKMRIIIMMTII